MADEYVTGRDDLPTPPKGWRWDVFPPGWDEPDHAMYGLVPETPGAVIASGYVRGTLSQLQALVDNVQQDMDRLRALTDAAEPSP